MSEISLHFTGSFTITGTMWEGFGRCGIPSRSSRARRLATARRWASRSASLSFRCRIETQAPAATAGGREVVKMKPEAKLRTKSHTASEAAM